MQTPGQTPGQNQEGLWSSDCIICLELADDAVVTDCCTQLLCQVCYQKVKDKCPICMKPYTIHVQKYLRKVITEISPQLSIVVQNLTLSYTLRIKSYEKIEILIKRIKEKSQTPQHQSYVFGGKQLDSNLNKSLHSIGFIDKSKVGVISQFKGGNYKNI